MAAIGGLEFMQGAEDEAGAAGTDGMAEGNGAATGIETVIGNLTEGCFQPRATGAGRIFETLENREHLGRESFVDLDDIRLLQADAAAVHQGI